MAISERFAATLFPSGVVGSLPRPLMVKEMLPDIPGPESAAAARSPQMDAAVRYAIAMQERAGIDLISDGEWRRHQYPISSPTSPPASAPTAALSLPAGAYRAPKRWKAPNPD